MTRILDLAIVLLCLSACGREVHVTASSPAAEKSLSDGRGPSGMVWEQGKQYDVIAGALPVLMPKQRVEVVEFFWYGCPHCYTLESHLVVWNRRVKPTYVDVMRVPVTWDDRQKAHARLYFSLKELGREDLHNEVFDTIHRIGNPLYDEDEKRTFQQQLEFAQAHGIGAQEFTEAYRSAAVNADLQRATDLARRYHVQHVPTLIVDGKYSTDPTRTKRNEAELIDTVNALVASEVGAGQGRVVSTSNTGKVPDSPVASK